jgi:uncharacterized membrane protein
LVTTVESLAVPAARKMPRWRRLLAHALTPPLAVRRAYPRAALRAVGAAIELAEAGHTGEIVFVAEASLPWSYLWRNASVRQRAAALFAELRVWDTEHDNGVLVYVGLADRAVEIVADRAIARRVDARQWHAICRDLGEQCRQGNYREGAVQAVRALGALMEAHFPLAPGQSRANELPDRPLAL